MVLTHTSNKNLHRQNIIPFVLCYLEPNTKFAECRISCIVVLEYVTEHREESLSVIQLKYLAAAAAAATPPRPPLGSAGPAGRVDPVTDNNNKTNTIIIYKTDVELYKTNTIKRQCKFIITRFFETVLFILFYYVL